MIQRRSGFINVDQDGSDVTPAVRAKLAELMVPEEEVLWSDRPVPSHAWTVIGTTFPRSCTIRAISMVVWEAFSLFGDSDTSTAWIDRGLYAVPNAVSVAARIDNARLARQTLVYPELFANE